ncbi:MAG: sulfate adenylyltransferase subunit CysN, partial [Planctomycetota bacterium]
MSAVLSEWITSHQSKDLLRFLTCGSVDDGKSTLIGRLLYDTDLVPDDQLAAVKKDSERHGTTGKGVIDLALLTDGLKAEREQGITIDVAYRYFSTAKRKFIIADCPGHAQYTRNMATGASTCQLAVILVDARYGVQEQTRRHAFIVGLLGIRHVVVAINKMDLVAWDPAIFARIRDEMSVFASRVNLPDLAFIPMSALTGDNVVHRGTASPWYTGPTLLEHLESVPIGSDRNLTDFRFPVQLALRPNLDFRGFAGTVVSGVVRVGDEVANLPSRRRSRVKSILVAGEPAQLAFAPQSAILTLEDEIDCSRGDLLAHPDQLPPLVSRAEAMLVWMHEEPLAVGRSYWVRTPYGYVPGTVSRIQHAVDVNTLDHQTATTVGLNAIAKVTLELSRPIPVDAYVHNRATGSFVLVDRTNNATVAAGMLAAVETPDQTAALAHPLSTRGSVIWITGLPAAGKTTLARELERRFVLDGRFVCVLDGDEVRKTLSSDLGFSAAERSEHLRRVGAVACLMADAGAIAIVACVSPYRAD